MHAFGMYSTGRRGTFEERFWRKVRKSEEPDGCWIWIASRRFHGYGQIAPAGVIGKPVPAHRASWEMHFGPIPDGLCVCHRCDVPACVRPDHLFLGTKKDNSEDMVAKGRSTAGPRNWSYKLTPEIVAKMRQESGPYSQTAKKFGVCLATAWRVRKFKQGQP